METLLRYLIIPVLLSGLVSLSHASYDQEALDRHNYFRRAHTAPMMTLNGDMSRSAQAYAERLARMGSLQHSSSSERPGQGENLDMTCGRTFTGATAVDKWYKEVCQFDFTNPRYASGTGHFTQLVWKGSTELGIGVASKDSQWGKCFYTVGRYRAAGNMMGSFGGNVAKGCFDYNSYCRSKGEPCTSLSPVRDGPLNPPPPPVQTTAERISTLFSSGGGSSSFAEEGLNKHNEYRSIHSAPDMTLNAYMNREAEAYAAKIARMGRLTHSNSRDGENLAMSCGREFTAAAATKMWYDEVCYYDFNYGGFSSRTGHFTQVVWKGSTELGMGKATSGRCTYVVGRYRRAGNYKGQYRKNVLKGSFSRGSTCQ